MRCEIGSKIGSIIVPESIVPESKLPDNKTIAVPETSSHEAKIPPLSTPVMVCPSPVTIPPPPESKILLESIESGNDHVDSSWASDDETSSKMLTEKNTISHLDMVYVLK
ncbi:MAG: hypothetical protein WCP92_01710 [bacterium]